MSVPTHRLNGMETLHVDCGSCLLRGAACDDCFVSVLLGPDEGYEFSPAEQDAVSALAGCGLIPPLRLTAGRTPTDTLARRIV